METKMAHAIQLVKGQLKELERTIELNRLKLEERQENVRFHQATLEAHLTKKDELERELKILRKIKI